MDELGVDLDRIALSGGSAGGGLCAAVALKARDSSGPLICFQFLAAPALDDRLETASMIQFLNTPVIQRASIQRCWEWYLGEPVSEISPYAAPARAEDLSGLPTTYMTVSEFDPLRDEGIEFAARLLAAGVSVELHCFPGTFHGSSMVKSASISQRQHAENMAVWRRALRSR